MGLDPHHLFKNLDTGSGLVVAISGGSDSLALLMLAHEYLRGTGTPLLAVTVDHQLRAEAALEAQAVAALCKAHGIQHRTMVWEGDKPSTGVIAAARDARYALLAQAARDFGANIILVGHTLDDQAETVAMRSTRGDGAGIAGMAPATLFDGDIWIVRPLLGARRQALRDYLSAKGQTWLDDPSNDNPKFERVRTRQAMDEATLQSLITRAASAAKERVSVTAQAARLINAHTSCPYPGLIRIEHDFFTDENKGAVTAFRALLATVGGTPHLPDEERTISLFRKIATRDLLRATLSRAVIDTRKPAVFVLREARDLPAPVTMEHGQVWDGRWRVSHAPTNIDLERPTADLDPKIAPQSLVRAALATMPPQAIASRSKPVVAPYARFMPAFDLDLAAALASLVGATPIPPSPWKQQNGAVPLTEYGSCAWQGPARCLC